MIEAIGADAAETLAALHARAFDKAWSAGELASLLQSPGAFALLAREIEPAGFVLARIAADEAEILTLAVLPEARRKGIAAALVRATAAAASAAGGRSLHLEVAEDNVAGRALYAKLGFEQTGRRRGYYASGSADALIMSRAL